MADELPPGYTLRETLPDQPTGLPEGYKLRAEPPAQKQRSLNLDLLEEAARNAPESFAKQIGQFISGLGDVIGDPLGTATNLGKLGLSTMPGAELTLTSLAKVLEPHLSEAQRKEVATQLMTLHDPKKALVKDLTDHYGGWQNILETAATDPFRIVGDIGMLAAPAAGAAGRTGQVARTLTRLDPLNVVGEGVTRGAQMVPRLLDMTTNTGTGVMGQAARAGLTGGTIARDFQAARRGEMPMEELVDRANQMERIWRNDMMNEYQAARQVWGGQPTPVAFAPIDRMATQIAGELQGAHGLSKFSETSRARIERLLDIVDEWQRQPQAHTIEGLDDLKQRLRSETDFSEAVPRDVTRMATRLTNSVRDAIVQSAPPSYREAMRAYTNTSRDLDELRRALSIGDRSGKTSVQTALTKLQSTMRDGANTSYGHRRNTLARLEEESGMELTPALAGMAANADGPRGITRGVISGGLPALGAYIAGTGDLVTGAAAGLGLAASSPRLMSGAMYAAGAAGRPFARLYNRMSPAARSVVRAPFTSVGRNALRYVDRIDDDGAFEFKRGGRAFARSRP